MNSAGGELDPSAMLSDVPKSRIPPEAYASYLIVIVQSALRMAEKNGGEMDSEFIEALLNDFDKRLDNRKIAIEGGPERDQI